MFRVIDLGSRENGKRNTETNIKQWPLCLPSCYTIGPLQRTMKTCRHNMKVYFTVFKKQWPVKKRNLTYVRFKKFGANRCKILESSKCLSFRTSETKASKF
jgi:hypothetical protein